MGDNNELMQKFRSAAMTFIEVVDAAPQIEVPNLSHNLNISGNPVNQALCSTNLEGYTCVAD